MTPDQTAAAPSAPKENLLGICHAIGEDLGIDPLFLRVPLAALLLWNPLVVVGAYAALGLGVLASRLAFPKPRVAASVATVAANEEAPLILAQAA